MSDLKGRIEKFRDLFGDSQAGTVLADCQARIAELERHLKFSETHIAGLVDEMNTRTDKCPVCGCQYIPGDAPLCGDNSLGLRIGCGIRIAREKDIYRCVDCQTPFHQQCLSKHCEDDLANLKAKLEAAESRLKDAVMLLRRCLPSGVAPKLRDQILGWIERQGLTGSILRDETIAAGDSVYRCAEGVGIIPASERIADLESSLKIAVAELDELKDSYHELSATASELHRKGESLCCQNGNLLVANHDLESRLKIAVAALGHYVHTSKWPKTMARTGPACAKAALDKIKEKS